MDLTISFLLRKVKHALDFVVDFNNRLLFFFLNNPSF